MHVSKHSGPEQASEVETNCTFVYVEAGLTASASARTFMQQCELQQARMLINAECLTKWQTFAAQTSC